ncbi:MAG: hypothetical protein IJD01_00565 [Clostridia bacterium]|nr:hypothetical protein [Clostridia bacterium]
MYITEARFAQMLKELLEYDEPCYETLNSIVRDCSCGSICAKGADYDWFVHEDMEDALSATAETVRLKVFSSFLFNKGSGIVNDDVGGFVAWVQDIASKCTANHIRKQKRFHGIVVPDGEKVLSFTASNIDEERRRFAESIDEVVMLVLEGKHQLHITLAWLLQLIYMTHYNCDHKDAMNAVLKYHSQATLTQIYGFVLYASKKLYCLRISPAQQHFMRQQLIRKDKTGCCLGDKRLEEFFNFSHDKRDGKVSLSKWWSNIRHEINGQFDDPTYKAEQKGTKRDEASDNS